MNHKIFKLTSAIVGVYHVLLGAAALLLTADSAGGIFKLFLGVNITITPEIIFIAKYVGVYLLAFGIMVLMLGSNPNKYRAFVWPIILMFAIRLLDRIIFFGALTSTFGMPASRNIIDIVLLLIFLVSLYATMPKQQA